jgi:pyruvate/2-oxoacid:ferredoxin oxidoreductase beta subunit
MDPIAKEFLNEHRYSQKRRKYANRYFHQDHSIFRSINSKRDVEIARNRVQTTLEMLKKVWPLERVDIEELEQEMGKYEIAVGKVIQNYEYEDFDYNVEELQELIDSIFIYYKKIDEVVMRRLFQD